MRWQGQELGVADVGALPGLEQLNGLVRSVTTLPPAEAVCRMLEDSGFEGCTARPLTAGMTTLWTAVRR